MTLSTLIGKPAWMNDPHVKCSGLGELFYPTQLSVEVAKAKAVCNGQDGGPVCPFHDLCLKYAIENHETFGVWGGTSERDRRKIQSARRRLKNKHIFTLEDVRFPDVVIIRKQCVRAS